MPTRAAIRLFLDFDGTLTRADTLSTLSTIGYRHHQRARPSHPAPPPWASTVAAYLEDFGAHESAYRPAKSERTTVRQEREWLGSLAGVEEASARRALGAGIWDGVVRDEVKGAVEGAVETGEVRCRGGWVELVGWVREWNGGLDNKGGVDVLSVNWSRRFVWECLRAASDAGKSCKARTVDGELRMGIYANELPSIAAERDERPDELPGADCRLRTSEDKVKQMTLLRCQRTRNSETGDGAGPERDLVVYVGDSTTDLECLLEADIGICIRDDPMGGSQRDLAGTCERVGVHVRPVTDTHQHLRTTNTLFWAKDFVEVKSFLSSYLEAEDKKRTCFS